LLVQQPCLNSVAYQQRNLYNYFKDWVVIIAFLFC
jgi:hypothetical protein